MATTRLTPGALPGAPWGSFAGKEEAEEAPTEKGAGPFTALSVLGVPGTRHSFSGKAEAELVAAVLKPLWRPRRGR